MWVTWLVLTIFVAAIPTTAHAYIGSRLGLRVIEILFAFKFRLRKILIKYGLDAKMRTSADVRI